jgi:hypothetical protein
LAAVADDRDLFVAYKIEVRILIVVNVHNKASFSIWNSEFSL